MTRSLITLQQNTTMIGNHSVHYIFHKSPVSLNGWTRVKQLITAAGRSPMSTCCEELYSRRKLLPRARRVSTHFIEIHTTTMRWWWWQSIHDHHIHPSSITCWIAILIAMHDIQSNCHVSSIWGCESRSLHCAESKQRRDMQPFHPASHRGSKVA